MIKKIHYIWLGGKIPPSVSYCINSWKKYCPDFEIIEWNEKNFNTNGFIWVREAIANKKYAFASDFIRLWILERYGGIYVDTDVEFKRNIHSIIKADFISAIENFHYGTHNLDDIDENGIDKKTGKTISGFGINAGFIYAEPHNHIIQHILKVTYYNGNRHFQNENGTLNQIIIDGILMEVLHKLHGLKYIDKTQNLNNNILIYNSEIISTKSSLSSTSLIIHWYDQTWNTKSRLIEKLEKLIKIRFPRLYRTLYYTFKKSTSKHNL